MADNAGLAPALDAIPMVADANARDARFPLATRKQNQRVFRLDTGVQQRWSGSAWVDDTVTTVNARTFATGDGTTDDRAAITSADAAAVALGAALVFAPGTYRIASNLTITSPIVPEPGATLVPDAGVTITLSGEIRAGLHRVFTLPATAHVAIARGVNRALLPEWWGAANGASAATNTTAIQECLFTSLGVTSLTAQPTLLYAPVELNALYPVTTVYLPRFTHIRGASQKRRYGFSSTANSPILVLGRSLAENDWVDITLEDVDLEGDLTKTTQVGIKATFVGASGSASPLTLKNVKISNLGGIGVELLGDATSMLVKVNWDNVMVYNTTSYAVHTKIGIFNHAHFRDCTFTDCGNGFYIEDDGSLTNTTETITFDCCQFEALGKPVGGTMGVGTFGFKSTVATGHYHFKDCYIEGNGNAAADTTGVGLYVRAPWNLRLTNCLVASSNNLFWMAYGGQAEIEGCYLSAGTNNTSILTLDQPQPGSDYSNWHWGKNKWASGYSDSQLTRVLNGALTTVTGYLGTANYVETPSRRRRVVYRDGRTKASDDGAIGYTAAKRLTDNSGGATTIAVGGVGTIVKNTFNGLLIVSVDLGANVGTFLVAAGGGIRLVNQVTTTFTTTKDTLTSVNVYHDAVLNAWVVQNKLASAIKVAVKLDGIDSLQHADDGYYETQFA